MAKNKIREKNKALKILIRLEEIRHEQKVLFKKVEADTKGLGFLKKLKIRQAYWRERDKLDLEADELTDKYVMILRSVRKFTKSEYLQFKDGLLDRFFLDYIFKDVS